MSERYPVSEMRKAAVATMLGLAIAATGAAPASASQLDRASARALIHDATTYARVSVSRRLKLRAAVRGFIDHIASSCPSALADAPPPIIEHAAGASPWHGGGEGTPAQQATSRTFLTATIGELKVAGFAPIRAPALALANELTHLRWTQPGVARALGDLGRSIIATMTLRPPNLCADARASAVIAFSDAPREATQFAVAVSETSRGCTLTALASDLGELTSVVRPFLAHSDLPAVGRFRRLWARAAPLLQIRQASVRRLLQAVYRPHPEKARTGRALS